jgi:hypothetical protein
MLRNYPKTHLSPYLARAETRFSDSFLACKGLDQRIIDDLEEQRRRYPHLLTKSNGTARGAATSMQKAF